MCTLSISALIHTRNTSIDDRILTRPSWSVSTWPAYHPKQPQRPPPTSTLPPHLHALAVGERGSPLSGNCIIWLEYGYQAQRVRIEATAHLTPAERSRRLARALLTAVLSPLPRWRERQWQLPLYTRAAPFLNRPGTLTLAMNEPLHTVFDVAVTGLPAVVLRVDGAVAAAASGHPGRGFLRTRLRLAEEGKLSERPYPRLYEFGVACTTVSWIGRFLHSSCASSYCPHPEELDTTGILFDVRRAVSVLHVACYSSSPPSASRPFPFDYHVPGDRLLPLARGRVRAEDCWSRCSATAGECGARMSKARRSRGWGRCQARACRAGLSECCS